MQHYCGGGVFVFMLTNLDPVLTTLQDQENFSEQFL